MRREALEMPDTDERIEMRLSISGGSLIIVKLNLYF